jgi:hypothetical protein
MQGIRAVDGMDLTYDVYGHLVRKDGTVIGLVTEAAWGRTIKTSDRALIYNTVARLQSRGCLYFAAGHNHFLIAAGKVRLTEPSSLTFYTKGDIELLEKDAEQFHWRNLHQLFWEFEKYGPFGNYRVPQPRFTASFSNLGLVIPPPSPERPLGGMFLHPFSYFLVMCIEPWPDYPENYLQQRRNEVKTFQQKYTRGTTIFIECDQDIEETSDNEEDCPLDLATALRTRGPRQSRAVALSYTTPSRPPTFCHQQVVKSSWQN